MATATQDPVFYVPENPVLARLVETAKAQTHDDPETAKRIHRAAALVETGAVAFDGPRCLVKSANALYPVQGTRCPCPDMTRRGTPCKHLYAKWLAIRLAQETAKMTHDSVPTPHRFNSPQAQAEWQAILARPLPGPLQFLQRIASLELAPGRQCSGLVTIWSDGRLLFSPYDSDERIACTYAEIVL